MSHLSGKRLLIVEDEQLVALDLEEELTADGLIVIGNYARLSEAIPAARSADVDCAILDLNLEGEAAYPIADFLRDRGIPFVFASGYGPAAIEERWADIPVVQKPFEMEQLRTALLDALVTKSQDKSD